MSAALLSKMAAREARLSHDRLLAALDYDPETGIFKWKANKASRATPGAIAGSYNDDRYRVIIIDGMKFGAHRLAWFYVHGKWPEAFIDHRNGVRDDNRIANLRDTSIATNQQNKNKAQSNNRLGLMGVHQNRLGGFVPSLKVKGVMVPLGTYETGEEAYAVYINAKRQFHPGWEPEGPLPELWPIDLNNPYPLAVKLVEVKGCELLMSRGRHDPDKFISACRQLGFTQINYPAEVRHGWHRSMALKRGSTLVKVLPAERAKRGAYLTTSISIGQNPILDN